MPRTPIKGTTPDPATIYCRNCIFRDRTEVKVGKKVIKVGIAKDTCKMYDGKPMRKPSEILFYGVECPYWEEDNGAGSIV